MDCIGRNIGDSERRAAWQTLVSDLEEAVRSGGPLEGWLVHGTTAARADSIARMGVTTTAVLMRDEDGQWLTDGTYWGTPLVAAFYAEDRIESEGDSDLALVLARLDDLAAEGLLVPDEQTLDCPLHERLGRSEEETWRLWDGSAQDWQACLDVFGTVVLLAPVPPEAVRIVRGAEDLEALLAEVAPCPNGP